MAQSASHRPLKIVLMVLAVVIFVGGLIALFWTSGIISMIPVVPQLSASLLTVIVIKALGILAVSISYLLYCASVDPVRYVAVIDFFIIVLLALAALDLWAVITQNFGTDLPSRLIWLRDGIRILLAVVLWVLRPKGASS